MQEANIEAWILAFFDARLPSRSLRSGDVGLGRNSRLSLCETLFGSSFCTESLSRQLLAGCLHSGFPHCFALFVCPVSSGGTCNRHSCTKGPPTQALSTQSPKLGVVVPRQSYAALGTENGGPSAFIDFGF